MAREDVQDFKLVESLFDVLGFSDAVKLQGEDGAADNAMAEQLMLSREQLSPIYRRLQGAGRMSTGRYQTQERRVGQESIALGTTTDSYELRFHDELKARSEVLAVGRDSSGTQVQVTYAISGKGLEPVTVTRGAVCGGSALSRLSAFESCLRAEGYAARTANAVLAAAESAR